MTKQRSTALASAAAACCIAVSSAQQTPISVLEVDIENITFYNRDNPDFSRYARDASRSTSPLAANFNLAERIGDIVAVNGTPGRAAEFVNSIGWPGQGQYLANRLSHACRSGTCLSGGC